MNIEKTRVNFPSEVEIDGTRVALKQLQHGEVRFMPWCGVLIDTATLEVRPNLARILSNPIRFSVSVELAHPTLSFRRAILTFIRMKIHALLLDGAINQKKTIVDNLFHLFVLAAMRTYAYIKKLKSLNINIHQRCQE